MAIKVLPAQLARDPERVARFEREARAASALNHSNIIVVHAIGHDNDVYWIATELVDGEPLNRVIERGPLPVKKAIDFAIQIADGLAAAHAAGIVHRDLKPGNIMITREGGVKILDFGLAKRQRTAVNASATVTKELTDKGTIMGTAAYMSPEQVRGEDADHRSDIFSLGLILHEMLSGKRTFAGDSSVQVRNAILTQDPPELPASVPAVLARIVCRCLQKESVHRFQSASDLAFALSSISGPEFLPVAKPRSRRWLQWAAAALTSIAIAITTNSLTRRSLRQSIPPEPIIRRLTNDPGITTGGAISPDGRFVAYASDRADPTNLDIWVQQVDGSGLVRVTDDTADDYDPAFSPDNGQLAFRSERKGGGIYVVSVLGGEARLLIPEGHRPRFSPDGQRLMYWTGPEPEDVRGSSDVKLWVRRVSGGEDTQIGAGCRLFERTPVWSPDGSRILLIGTCGNDLVTRGSQPEDFGLAAWVFTLDGKGSQPNRELHGLWSTIHGDSPVIDQWIANPSRLLIPVAIGDATSITSVPVSTDGTSMAGPLQRLTIAGGKAVRVSAALNGRLVLSAETTVSHIWSLPIGSEGTATGLPKQVTYGPAGEVEPLLSKDGEKLAFLSSRANGVRLFYKDLATGLEKEVSTEGYRYETPLFSQDGTKIMCVQYPSLESWRDFVFEVPVSGGGLSKKVWDRAAWTLLWDWAPDDSTLLIEGWKENHSRRVDALDLKSGVATAFLNDPENLEQAHFSHNGRWVTFQSSPWTEFASKPSRSSLFIVPFRKAALVPRSEWIPIVGGNMDFDPHFSFDDKFIFFVSERDGFNCLWGQRLGPDGHPIGDAFAVYHAHERKHPLVQEWSSIMGVGAHAIAFTRSELSGNIWLLGQNN